MTGGLAVGDRFSLDGLDYCVTSVVDLEVCVTGFSGSVLSVPANVTYNGVSISVTSVADKAFYGCETLRVADLSNVKSIGMKAFANCSSIRSVEFGHDLESIGAYAFYGLSFYDGDTKISLSPESLSGHSFSGIVPKLYLES